VSPLGDAIVALILTIVIGYAIGFVLCLIGHGFLAAGFMGEGERVDSYVRSRARYRVGLEQEDAPTASAVRRRFIIGGACWVLGIALWITTLVLVVFRIIDVVAAATS
jgi:hypothetical protein